MPVIENTPGSRLQALRKGAGLSAASLAERLGCATSAVSNHENGINGIRAETAARYAELLGTTPQYILYGDGEPAGKAAPTMRRPGVALSTLANGKARLEMSVTLPFVTALQILTLVEGVEQ